MKYAAPTTVEEAQAALAGAGARVFAGATDLIPQMRAGLPEPETIVDLKRIPRLIGIGLSGTTWTIGAATPASQITRDTGLVADFPGLTEAAGLIGSDQIQNRASLGGNLCNASPAADSVPAMVVNDVQAVIASDGSTRTVPAADVPTGPGSTSLAPDELLVELTVERPPPDTADAYLRFIPRTEMDIAVVGAAVRLTVDGAGICTDAVIALGAVAPTVVRVPAAEEALRGRPIDDDVIAAVAAAARDACNPIDDRRGTIAYRTQVAGVLAGRAVRIAAQRATGGDQ